MAAISLLKRLPPHLQHSALLEHHEQKPVLHLLLLLRRSPGWMQTWAPRHRPHTRPGMAGHCEEGRLGQPT